MHVNTRNSIGCALYSILSQSLIDKFRLIARNILSFPLCLSPIWSNKVFLFLLFPPPAKFPITKTLCRHLSSDDDNKTQSSKQFALNSWCGAKHLLKKHRTLWILQRESFYGTLPALVCRNFSCFHRKRKQLYIQLRMFQCLHRTYF